MKDVHLNGIQVEDLDNIPFPYSHMVNLVAQGVNAMWTQRWLGEVDDDGRPRYRQSKFFYKEPDARKAYTLMRQDRITLGKVIQFITGHTFLNRPTGHYWPRPKTRRQTRMKLAVCVRKARRLLFIL